MRLGLQVFGSDTGLGVQTRSLYKHLHPAKTMLVDLSAYNKMPVHDEWYSYDLRTTGFPTYEQIDSFLDGLDVVLVCETPLNYQLFSRARQRKIGTVLQFNFEFLDYLTAAELRRPTLPRPDALAAPTTWNIRQVQQLGMPVELLPVPIDREQLPQRTITHARHFFHVAGRPAIHDRNGSLDFIAAVKLAAPRMPDAHFTIYCQQPTPDMERALEGTRIQLVGHVEHPADMYRRGEILVLPRRYGGLCLPAREAVGSGIPVLMPDVSPNNSWLPRSWLVPVLPQVQQFMTRTAISLYRVNVPALANRMVSLYENVTAVCVMHEEAKRLAVENSWPALLPRYEQVLAGREVAV